MKKRFLCRALPVSVTAIICVGLLRGLLLPGPVSAQGSDGAGLPEILSFEIAQTSSDGDGAQTDWVELRWQTENADRVRLYRDGKELKGRHQLSADEVGWPVSMDGGLKIRRPSAARFELVAENEQGEISRVVDVEARSEERPPAAGGPEILELRIEPSTIAAGDPVRFYWKTRNAYRVELHDDHGEIESRIVLPKGNFGWPLAMDGAVSESPTEPTTYRLVAVGKAGSVSESFQVEVAGGDCQVQVTVSGKFGQHTDGIAVYRAASSGPGDFLADHAVRTVRDRRSSRDPELPVEVQRARFTVPTGEYFLVPRGGGEDGVGPFSVLYRPGRSRINCAGGSSERLAFIADHTEY